PEFKGANGKTILESPQPRAHFAQALSILYPAPPLCPGIHPTASVGDGAAIDPTADIGAFVAIGQGAQGGARARGGSGSAIGARARIGDDCVLHARVSVYSGVAIGARSIIHSGAVIGADGFGFELVSDVYQKIPQVGTVKIGEDVEIGANSCVDRGTLGASVIGAGTMLDNLVHIA